MALLRRSVRSRLLPPRAARAAALVAALALVLAAASCSTIGYYWQGAAGQVELLRRAEPIDRVVAKADTEEALRVRLARIAEIRRFASESLALPDNGSYRRYAALARPYVVWNVIAAPPLSLAPREWCFPIAGCVSYRGFFAEAHARAEAARLSAEGLDVYVGGVPAYSTLGWFDDPVLSTFVNYPEPELARLIFHELAHQVVYVRDDSTFNESFAAAVEEEGVRRWLEQRADDALARQFERAQRVRAEFRDLVRRYRDRLQQVYDGPGTDEARLAAKARALEALAADYRALKSSWGGFAGYDAWFAAGANNASLAAVGLYTDLVPAFRSLFAASGSDFARFYAAVRELAARPPEQRRSALGASPPAQAGNGPG